jgi:Glycoside Hydrolase Family 113
MRALLVVSLLAASSPIAEAPSRRDLLRSLRANELVVVYGADDRAVEDRLKAAAQSLAPWRTGSITLLRAADVDRGTLSRGAVALVGTPTANRFLADLARALPLEFRDRGFRIASKDFDAPGDSIQLLYPNPLCPEAPLLVVAGNSDAAVLHALGKRRRDDVQVRRNGRTLLLARFGEDWTLGLGPGSLQEFPSPDEPELVTRHFAYFTSASDASEALPGIDAFARVNESTRARIETWFGPPPKTVSEAPLAIHVYPSLERKGLVTDDTAPAHAESDSLHVVLGLGRGPERLVARTLLDRVLPRETTPVLRNGLSTVLVEDERELDELDRLSRGLLRTSSPPRVGALEGESPFVVEAVSASFARFVLGERGPGAFRERLDLSPLEARWRAALERESFSPAPFPPSSPSFRHGFTYSQEGFDIHDGYLSARSDSSLERLAGLGVDSVAIVPYAFMNGPSSPELSLPSGPGAETDEGVIHVIRSAKAKGMTVLLKPQIWVRRGWPGEIELRTAADEERFFHAYSLWMRHYALMAEENGVPVLSIGCELARLTHSRRARWESLVRDLRAVYRGELVYSANWGEEVERVDFWPLLDYIGVDFYYPLSTDDAPSDESLRAGFAEALARVRAVAERERKPVLLTEIGYASTRSPWKSPHASDREPVPSPEAQARVYDVALAGVAGETKWIRGMYWWKWPSDLERGGNEDRGFTPNGKPAEEIVRRWYRGRIQ